jgi:hypothetical protein
MSLTFSINENTITETSRIESIVPVLNNLPNNTSKLISPRDVRDAFLTTWSNAIFKITTPDTLSSYPYIGIDTNDPNDRDYKKKILLGKRSFGSLDVMGPSLLNSDTDIFFYNTKEDSATQSSTKISIIAGTNSLYYSTAPYIESFYTGSSVDFNLTNSSGPINLTSGNRVSINNITFPTIAETASDVADGKVLRYVGTYPTGSFQWVYPSVTSITIGSTSSTTNIYGSPVLLNGQPLEFVEDSLVPVTIGGVLQGMSFSSGSYAGQDWPMVEVIRMLLYPYTIPGMSISVENASLSGGIYAEVNTINNIFVDYSVTRYSYDIADYKIEITPGLSIIATGSYSGLPGTGISSSTSTSIDGSVLYPNLEGTATLSLWVSDWVPGTFTHSVTAEIEFVNPIYYGFYPTIITGPTDLNSFITSTYSNKLILPYGTQSYYDAQYDGSGYLYFIYPNSFTDNLSEIKDPNSLIIHDENSFPYSAFTYSSINRTTGFTLNYDVWRTTYTTSYDGPNSFMFKF